MAVCGRCLLCGYKFNGKTDDLGDEPDVAIRWACNSKHDECSKTREWHDRVFEEIFEHAICVRCHDGLVSGALDSAVGDLVELLARRSQA